MVRNVRHMEGDTQKGVMNAYRQTTLMLFVDTDAMMRDSRRSSANAPDLWMCCSSSSAAAAATGGRREMVTGGGEEVKR